MKKEILFLILILIIPNILAIEFDMKDNVSQGETVIAKISGNFAEPILAEDVYFYRGHTRVSLPYDLSKLDDNFYIYFQTGDKEPNNYSIVIKDTKYYNINQIIEEDLTKNFTINSYKADFSVTPGFVKTNQDFYLTIQNLQNFDITVSMNFGEKKEKGFFASLFGGGENAESTYELYSGEITKIYFEVEEQEESSLEFITLSSGDISYEIPLQILAKDNSIPELNFRFNPADLDNITLALGSETTRITYLENTGDDKLTNITLEVSEELKPYIGIFPETIDELDYNDSQKITLTIISENASFDYEGQLKARSNGLYAYSTTHLYFIEGFVPENGITEINDSEEIIITPNKTCASQGGIICKTEEQCSGQEGYAKDGLCCVGSCGIKNKDSSGKIIGWGLLVILIAFLAWFFMKKFKK